MGQKTSKKQTEKKIVEHSAIKVDEMNSLSRRYVHNIPEISIDLWNHSDISIPEG
jgi:hypothetical protein